MTIIIGLSIILLLSKKKFVILPEMDRKNIKKVANFTFLGIFLHIEESIYIFTK